MNHPDSRSHSAKRKGPGHYEYRGHTILSYDAGRRKAQWKILDPAGVEIYTRQYSVRWATEIIDRDLWNESRRSDTTLG